MLHVVFIDSEKKKKKEWMNLRGMNKQRFNDTEIECQMDGWINWMKRHNSSALWTNAHSVYGKYLHTVLKVFLTIINQHTQTYIYKKTNFYLDNFINLLENTILNNLLPFFSPSFAQSQKFSSNFFFWFPINPFCFVFSHSILLEPVR